MNNTVVLTPKEKEVYDVLILGFKNKEIARKLGKSTRTVETHVRHILQKSGLRTRYQVALRLHPQSVEVHE